MRLDHKVVLIRFVLSPRRDIYMGSLLLTEKKVAHLGPHESHALPIPESGLRECQLLLRDLAIVAQQSHYMPIR